MSEQESVLFCVVCIVITSAYLCLCNDVTVVVLGYLRAPAWQCYSRRGLTALIGFTEMDDPAMAL